MDIVTVIIYIILSLVNMSMLKLAVVYKTNHNEKYAGIINITIIFYMTVFAAGRFVSQDGLIGGADALGYIMRFKNAEYYFSNFQFFEFMNLRGGEPFYTFLTLVVRFFTDNYHIYYIVIYGIIISCFVYFVYNMYEKNSNWFSVILLTLYYIYSFNIMRTMLAAALCAVAVVKIKKSNWRMAFLFSLLAFFSHYTAIIFFPIIMIAFLYRKKPFKIKTCKLLALAVCCNIVSYMAFAVISYIFSFTRYYTYFLGETDYSVLGWIPSIFLCVIVILFASDFIEYNNANYLILIAMGLDLALMYIMIARMGWRMNDYFHLIRMFVLSEICAVTEKRLAIGTSRIIVKVSVNLFIVMLFVQFLFSLRVDGVYPYIFLCLN